MNKSSFFTLDKSGIWPNGSGIFVTIVLSQKVPKAASLGDKPASTASADCFFHDMLKLIHNEKFQDTRRTANKHWNGFPQ